MANKNEERVKMFYATSKTPNITNNDTGIWRRICFMENEKKEVEKMENKIKFKIEMEIEVLQTELEGLYRSSYTQLKSFVEDDKRIILEPDNGKLVNYSIKKFERL